MSSSLPVRPSLLSECEIARLMVELYGLHVELVQEFDSYYDRNYLVEEVSHGDSTRSVNSIQRSDRYVLKVLSSIDSKNPAPLGIQNDVILFAKQAGYPLPAPLPNLEGDYQKLMSFENKTHGITETSLVRVFEYYPGTTLEKVKLTKPLCREIGHCGGWLNKICMNFKKYDESDYSILKRDWNLSQVSCLWDMLDVVEDPGKRSLVSDIISTFEKEVLKNEDKFSKGFIHSDINDCNMIVNKASHTSKDNDGEQNGIISHHNITNSNGIEDDTYHITALIDFGDICYSCHLYEIGIAMCYVLINKSGIPPLAAAGCVLSGYLKHIQLSDFELENLKTCVCTRLAQSIVMGLNTLKANPENIYNLFHSSRMWEPMEAIWQMSNKEFLQELFKEID